MDDRLLNPILPGFNPDPAICRRGDEFYVATSSFQWWPGAPIYRSRDLRCWELAAYGLTRPDHADLRRIGDSAGVWAPSLTYADGLFWLVFTIASGSRQHAYECWNYLTTAPEVSGPWSDPVYLNAAGNDPGFFHDLDGRKWLVNTKSSLIPGYKGHYGAVLQEYSVAERRLVGPAKVIFEGTPLGTLEGSKMIRRGDWYYLGVAEGGTEYGHAMTLARSRHIWGPYEVHPDNPVLTARGSDSPIQRAGHGDWVTLDDDRVALVYLASRPVERKSLLGRETYLARARWGGDGWLRLDSRAPQLELPDFGLPEAPVPPPPEREDFDGDGLGLHWNSLRGPVDDLIDLQSRPGWLALRPTPSPPDSFIRPALIAQRVRHHRFSAETLVDFRPDELQQWAGLICYYDTRHWYYLHRQYDERDGHCVALYAKRSARFAYEDLGRAPVDAGGPLRLGVDCDGRRLRFRLAPGAEGDWRPIGEPQDALVLSDEFVEQEDEIKTFGFTGAFVGLLAHDITGRAAPPTFDWFDYRGDPAWLDLVGSGGAA